ATVQHPADLLEREPELPQRPDLLEPRDVPLPVQPVAGAAARRRPQEPDPVVVVERADRQSCPAGQLTDLPVVPLHLVPLHCGKTSAVRVSAWPRVNGTP